MITCASDWPEKSGNWEFGEARGKGVPGGIEFVQDPKAKKHFPAQRMFGKRVQRRLLEKGLILRCDPDWVAVAPPLITTQAQADEIVDILMELARRVG